MAQHPISITITDIPEFEKLSTNSTWSYITYFLGWHLPSLPESSKRITNQIYLNYERSFRKYLFRKDLIPHNFIGLDQFNPNCLIIQNHYKFTYQLRYSAIRDIHKIYKNKNKNKVERYSKNHLLWYPESEIRWLNLFIGMRDQIEGYQINFPWGLRLVTSLPNQMKEIGETISICFNGNKPFNHQGYYTVKFGDKLRPSQQIRSIQFDRFQSKLFKNQILPILPKSDLGEIWIEKGIFGPTNRILFKKTCCDEKIGILVWPQLPGETSIKTYKPTPRIPVYRNDIIELADNDRLLIFVGPKRGLNDITIQINVNFCWIMSSPNQKPYADTKYCYPNPCERYPHCLKRPIYSPLQSTIPEILEDVYKPINELPKNIYEHFEDIKNGISIDYFNELYKEAKEDLLNEMKKGKLPGNIQEFLNGLNTHVETNEEEEEEYIVEHPIEKIDQVINDDDDYKIEILDDDDDEDQLPIEPKRFFPSHSFTLPGPSCLKKEKVLENRRRSVTFVDDNEDQHNTRNKRKLSNTDSHERLTLKRRKSRFSLDQNFLVGSKPSLTSRDNYQDTSIDRDCRVSNLGSTSIETVPNKVETNNLEMHQRHAQVLIEDIPSNSFEFENSDSISLIPSGTRSMDSSLERQSIYEVSLFDRLPELTSSQQTESSKADDDHQALDELSDSECLPPSASIESLSNRVMKSNINRSNTDNGRSIKRQLSGVSDQLGPSTAYQPRRSTRILSNSSNKDKQTESIGTSSNLKRELSDDDHLLYESVQQPNKHSRRK
ncbi:hypothetical protein CROQUDRAFT_712652 [Cronartium quercuum f. sp. fusiforme G11]|uniref:Uncharacterized protein n=1 Tax=Cronartium quercuum f. sp. fusiforme G11 TaxID=708437 RepID=A0A9P6TIC8_9BASI|nr:hypothetical protein CROQUDRAFT_712652 [Cronartium quercuum f. sp. fusiforme G11]